MRAFIPSGQAGYGARSSVLFWLRRSIARYDARAITAKLLTKRARGRSTHKEELLSPVLLRRRLKRIQGSMKAYARFRLILTGNHSVNAEAKEGGTLCGRHQLSQRG